MREGIFLLPNLKLIFYSFLLFSCINEFKCEALDSFPNLHDHKFQHVSSLMEKRKDLLPDTSPNKAPQPFIPLLAPSPLAPFTNNSVPRLSGLCTLNFSAAETMLSTTAVDCWAFFAPFLANVICCPQLYATLVVLIGKSSKDTGRLALDKTQATHCLLDVQEILAGQGANGNLEQICSIRPSNLTEGSCPIHDVNELEGFVDSSRLLAACKKVDPVAECCSQICQNEILEVATTIANKRQETVPIDGKVVRVDQSSMVDDCKQIVVRWLASKLDPLSAKQVLRRISNCNLNKACPLVFPNTRNVGRYCKSGIDNQTSCCIAMGNYISHLQKQSFITNLQALDCASLLGAKLQTVNITKNVYGLCHITLKDFSLQVGSQESGCLLPSLPSDATFDRSSGISFTCDLNDNIAAPWPSTSQQMSISSCNKTIKLPALPAATSGPGDPLRKETVVPLLLFSVMVAAALL